MDDRGIIPTSRGIAHLITRGIVATMGGINPIPGSITPTTRCIIPMTMTSIIFLMAAVVVPMPADFQENLVQVIWQGVRSMFSHGSGWMVCRYIT
jgi:hypothetical protein